MNRRSALIGWFAACAVGGAAFAAEPVLPESPKWTSLTAMHADYLDAFVHSDGFGMRRVSPMMRLMQSGELRLDSQLLRVEEVQMIGIAKHDPPVVHQGGMLKFQHGEQGPELLPGVAQRPLNAQEVDAVRRLQAGGRIVSLPAPGAASAVGPIRATADCLQCHQSKKEGDLLGAFVYTLRPAIQQAL
jgi:hypothetical protein